MVNITGEAWAEVYDIIKHMQEGLIRKIPMDFINIIKQNQDESYVIDIDYSKPISQQNLLKDTKIVLSLIYREYLCDYEKREILKKQDEKELKILEEELEKIEAELREQHDPDKLFKI